MTKRKYEIGINYLLLVFIPLFFSLGYIFLILPSYQFNFLDEVYLYYFGGFIFNFLLNIIFYGISFSLLKLVIILFLKLLLVYFYVTLLINKDKRIKYIISILLSITGIVTGHFYLLMLTFIT